MNELPDLTTRRTGLVVLAVVAIALGVAAFVWTAYRHDVMRRQSETAVAAQTAAAQQLQANASQPAAGWQLVRQVPVSLQEPVALATAAGRTYLVGSDGAASHALLVLDGNLQPTASVPLPEAPRAVSVAPDGLLVTFDSHAVLMDSSGKVLRDFRVSGERARLTSVLAVGQEVWVGDSGQRLVWRFARSGALVGKLGAADPATGYPGLLVPSPHLDLALTPSGSVLLNNPGKQRVEFWSKAGKLTGQFGKASMEPEGFAGCCNPIAIAALPDGRVVTAEKGLVRVKVYRANGTLDGVVATTPVLSRGVTGLDLATTSAGEVLVLDPRAHRIAVFSENKAAQGSK